MMELSRTELLTELDRMARSGSLLVVGRPGAGKSWLLQQFALRREKSGDAAVLILAEDHNYVASLRQLEDSLKIPAGLIPTLKAYGGSQKFLIIDSLDALRAEASQRVFRQLIRQVQRELPEWKVVASIRSFDAKESLELQRLFPRTSQDTGLMARHLTVPLFTDGELGDAKQQDPRLAPIIESASPGVLEILRNAFNLWLVVSLLDEHIGIEWLYAIESETQLFERYWHYRIGAREDSYDRLSILTNVSSEMVSSRTLSVPFKDAYQQAGTSKSFSSLLSDEVLHRTATQRIAYSHNILFDFSVAKLLLDEERLFPFLRDPDRSIFFRPSISYFLSLMWYQDRNTFWKIVPKFFTPDYQLPPRVHVLPGIAIFNSVVKQEELTPLLSLGSSAGVDLILSLLRALQAFGGMTSSRASVWLDLLCELSNRLDISFINEYLVLLEIAANRSTWTIEEQRRLLSAASTLLTWMWEQAAAASSEGTADQLLAIAAGRVIPLIPRFYPLDPEAVRQTLQKVLDRIGRPDVSVREAYSLANNLDQIIEVDPAFAVNVYESTFAHEEKSQKQTDMGGKVLVLTSTRAQDYSMAYYILGVRFNTFLQQNLPYAALAAVRSVSAQVRREHGKATRRIGHYSARFKIYGVTSKLVADRSEFWDQGYRDNISLQLLDALLSEVAKRLKAGELSQEVAWGLFQLIAKENQYPVTWKRLLERANHTEELLPFAVALLQTPEILAAPETSVVAGDLISAHFAKFTNGEREQIEAAIWEVPSLRLSKLYHSPDDQRNRLLSCIPEEYRNEQSNAVVSAAKSSGELHANRPFFKIGPVSTHSYTQEDWLRDHGTDTETGPNRTRLDAKRDLSAFETKYLNEIPSREEIERILPALRVGFDLVIKPEDADERVLTDVFTSVAAVAESITKNKDIDPKEAAAQLVRDIIVKAAIYPYPEPSEGADEHFDRPGWGPTPKIEAAQGVMHLISNWGLDEELEQLVSSLRADKSPAVRFQIVDGLGAIYQSKEDLFWQIADSMRTTEKAAGVLSALVRVVGQAYIARREPERVVAWFKALLGRALPKQRPEDIYEAIFSSLVYLYVFCDRQSADQLLRTIEKSPTGKTRQLHNIADAASYYLDYKLEEADSEANSVRIRARNLELRVLVAVDKGLQLLEARSRISTRAQTKRGETAKQLLMIVDRIVFRLYMIVGANPQLTQSEGRSINEPAVGKFVNESVTLWEAVVSADAAYRRPMGPSTAHHLMECFNHLLRFDPGLVLKLTWWLITGRTLGYQFDKMAIQEFVNFAERILADHKALLQNEVNAVRFAEILDVFVSAGWSEATQIVMRMDAAIR
jgi:KaiC/GvpD/RAD55 family RecA-like ATPase